MIQYEEHAAVSNGRRRDREFIPDPAHAGAVGRYGDADDFGSGQDDPDYARSLSTLIENDIIPRLMVAHATMTPLAIADASKAVIGPEEIAAFAPLAMQVEAETLLVHVEAVLTRGVAIDTVLVDLLAPTARLLAEFWEEERCDFVDVTMALWRLQEVVHELSRRLTATQPSAGGVRSVPDQASEHDFATAIDDIFRRNGWLADRLRAADERRSAGARGGRTG